MVLVYGPKAPRIAELTPEREALIQANHRNLVKGIGQFRITHPDHVCGERCDPTKWCACGHPVAQHSGSFGCIAREDGEDCRCERVGVAA